MLNGFKEFISRGNAIDMAVGIIIGGAFTPIVTAITDSVLLPLIGAIFGEPNFDTIGQFVVNGATISPGTIVTALVNFLLIAAALYFAVVMPMNKLAERRKTDEEEPEEKADDVLVLEEIRDLLRTRSA
ncbi:large conductance mechanosensitive channel protein MscL [Georgenia sp. Z1491]|uniref:large conductance mechanosensitive channel protein MscL n=1 Tax=Georgenia sp. Z1491 TaxID=3416707 RepID=UPI003CEDE293